MSGKKKAHERVRLQPPSHRVNVGKNKLTEEIANKIEELLLLGTPEGICFNYLSIARRTYWNWKRWGQDYLDAADEDKNPLHRRYAKFVLRVNRATAEWQVRLLRRSFQGTYQPTWVRDMALLERRSRTEWGKKEEDKARHETYDPDESYL